MNSLISFIIIIILSFSISGIAWVNLEDIGDRQISSNLYKGGQK
jgi:hypothetical protein